MKKIFITILFLLSFFVLIPVQATTIYPAIIDVSADPGETVEKTIILFNETDSDLYLDGYVEVFVPQDESGKVKVLPPQENNLAVTWIKLPVNSVALAPGEQIEVPLIINIPQTVGVGGYYLAIMWEAGRGPWTGDSQVNTSARVGNLVLLKVKGEVEENLAILNFDLSQNSAVPTFSTRIKNQGNIHLQPQGIILIKNFLGVSDVLEFNRSEKYILPQSIKKFEDIWADYINANEGNWWQNLQAEIKQFPWGKVSARLELEYGESKTRVSSNEISFWVIPWRLISLLFVIFVVIILIKIIRRKNR